MTFDINADSLVMTDRVKDTLSTVSQYINTNAWKQFAARLAHTKGDWSTTMSEISELNGMVVKVEIGFVITRSSNELKVKGTYSYGSAYIQADWIWESKESKTRRFSEAVGKMYSGFAVWVKEQSFIGN